MTLDRTSLELVLARSVHMGACLLALSVFVFDRLIVAGASRQALPVIQRRWTGIARRLVIVALPLAALSGLFWLVVSAQQAADPDVPMTLREQVQAMWNTDGFGQLWQWRSLILIAACLAALPALVIPRPSLLHDAWSWFALACTAGLAVTIARAGHGRDFTQIHQIADAAHMLIGGAWPAGLLPMALLLRRLRREPTPDRWTATFAVTNRFSAMSLVCVLLLGTSGVINSLPLIDSFHFLFTSAYGRVLMVKIGLFALMIAMGAINLLYLRPRLSLNLGSATDAQRLRAINWLQFTVWMEIVLAIGIIIAVGILGEGTLQPACCESCCAPG